MPLTEIKQLLFFLDEYGAYHILEFFRAALKDEVWNVLLAEIQKDDFYKYLEHYSTIVLNTPKIVCWHCKKRITENSIPYNYASFCSDTCLEAYLAERREKMEVNSPEGES